MSRARRLIDFAPGAVLFSLSLIAPAVRLPPTRELSGLDTLRMTLSRALGQLIDGSGLAVLEAAVATLAATANLSVIVLLASHAAGAPVTLRRLVWALCLAGVGAGLWLGWRVGASTLVEIRYGYGLWVAGLALLLIAAWPRVRAG